MTDAELLLASRRDPAAFRELYDRWADRLLAYFYLTVGERDAVRLRVLEELDYRTIAARLGCSEGAARGRVHRGLVRLAQLMEVTR